MVGYYIYLEFANTFFHFRSFDQDVIYTVRRTDTDTGPWLVPRMHSIAR